MYYCPFCKQHVVVKVIQDVRHHLNEHKKYGALSLPIGCRQIAGCKTSLGSIAEYIRHFKNFHSHDLDAMDEQPAEMLNSQNFEMSDALSQLCNETSLDGMEGVENNAEERYFEDQMKKLEESIRNEIFCMILDLRGKGSVTYQTTLQFVEILTSIVDSIVDSLNFTIKSTLSSLKNICEIPPKIEQINIGLDKLKTATRSYDSEYKIQKHYHSHPLFVPPEPLVMNQSFETNQNGRAELKYNCAQYSSLKKTIQAKAKADGVFKMWFPEGANATPMPATTNTKVYSNFFDGDRYKKLNAEKDPKQEYILYFQVYEDATGFVNPFSANSSYHSSAMFYFALLLPGKTTSRLCDMDLIAIVNSMDLKNAAGIDKILDCIVQEILEFETDGIEVEVPHKGVVRVYGRLAHFTGDNLAVNQMFGFVEGFSGDYCCAICYAKRNDMQTFNREKDFKLRNLQDYSKDLEELEDSDALHVRGVKRYCKLNDLRYFHIVLNFVNDCMHTVSQGIIPHVTSCVLYSLWKGGYITVEIVNNRLREIFSKTSVDKKDKPCELNTFLPPGQGISPKFSAAQMCTFFRYLPMMLAPYIDPKNEHWILFLMLQEVVDLVFAPRLTESTLGYFELLYSEFFM
jgi:hypothetical protein